MRVGARIALELTVHLPGHGTVTRRMLVPPRAQIPEGGQVTVRYDPGDPANFEPLPALHAAAS